MPPALPTFETLMLPHLDAAYNLARWLLRDAHDAEDAVQDACLRAYRAFDRFRGNDGRAWLLTIVRNVCYSELRKNQHEPIEVAFVDETHGNINDSVETKALAYHQVKQELLQRALEALPVEFREILILHEIEGLAYREIAIVAEIPIGTVMSRLARARQKLQTEVLTLSQKGVAHGL